MTDEQLILKYPELFGLPPFDQTKTLIGFGFKVNKGWLPILEKGFKKISKIINEDHIQDFRIRQVKEKFGGLCIYCNYYMDQVDEVIEAMEKECDHTCDLCGSPEGKLRQDMWLTVRCNSCYDNWKKKYTKGKLRMEDLQQKANEYKNKLAELEKQNQEYERQLILIEEQQKQYQKKIEQAFQTTDPDELKKIADAYQEDIKNLEIQLNELIRQRDGY